MSDISVQDEFHVNFTFEICDARERLAALPHQDGIVTWVRNLLSYDDTPAFLGLGIYYWKGFVREPDKNKAYFWTELAATRQSPERRSTLEVRGVAKTHQAYFLLLGIGGRKDFDEAVLCLQETANDPIIGLYAKFLLAKYWMAQRGLRPQQKLRAVNYLREVAQAGYVDAIDLLTRCFREGFGVRANHHEADKLEETAKKLRQRSKGKSKSRQRDKVKSISAWFPLLLEQIEEPEEVPANESEDVDETPSSDNSYRWDETFEPPTFINLFPSSGGTAVADKVLAHGVELVPDSRDTDTESKPKPQGDVLSRTETRALLDQLSQLIQESPHQAVAAIRELPMAVQSELRHAVIVATEPEPDLANSILPEVTNEYSSEVVENLLTISQVAEALGRNPSGLRAHCERGTLKGVKKGKTWLISPAALAPFLAAYPDEKKPGPKGS